MEKTLPAMTALGRRLAEDALGEARNSLSSALFYALATRAEETDDLLAAYSEQVDLTAKIHEAGLLPRGLSMECKAGPFPTALVWIEKNINQLLADPHCHPVFRQWAELNDQRHRIKHLLPTLN